MAYPNKVIFNTKTGQEIRFLRTAKETGGRLLHMEATYLGHSKEPVPHYHPNQEEDFTVISGTLNVRLDGKLMVLHPGDTLHIPKNKVHSMWNGTDEKTKVNWEVRPGLKTEAFLENLTGLANEGKTDPNGMPNLLQVALLANRHAETVRLANPPFLLQKIVFLLLAPFAYILGYRSSYKKYID